MHVSRLSFFLALMVPAVIVVGLTACESRDSASAGPEQRATQFLDVLVKEPANQKKLAALAVDPSAPMAAPLRIAIDLLRVRHRQGAALRVRAEDAVTRPDGSARVAVSVQFETAGQRDRLPFELSLRAHPDGWRVESLRLAE